MGDSWSSFTSRLKGAISSEEAFWMNRELDDWVFTHRLSDVAEILVTFFVGEFHL